MNKGKKNLKSVIKCPASIPQDLGELAEVVHQGIFKGFNSFCFSRECFAGVFQCSK